MKKSPLITVSVGCVGLVASALGSPFDRDSMNALLLPSTGSGSPWEMTGAASVGLAKGNSDSLSYSLQFLATYEKGSNEAFFGADWFYSESEGIASTDSFRLHGQYNRLLSERLYTGLNASILTDSIADIDYRADLGVVLGYYVIKNDTTSLAFEAGPGVTWESQGDVSRNFLTVRFAERFEHQLTRRSKLWQSAIFTPNIDDFGDYNLVFEAGIDTVISSQWALRTSLRYQYDSTPAAGRQSDDTTLQTGLSYSLGGFPEPAEAGRQTLKPADAAPEAIQMGWSTTAALGVSLASGNSDSLSVGLSFDSAYREANNELFFTGNYSYTETGGTTSADALRASAQYNRLLSDRVFMGAGVGFLRDDLADVNYRFTPALTMGYYLIKGDEMTLSLEAGPGYTFEKVGGISDSYFSVVGAEKFTWELSDRMTFKQSLSIALDPSNTDDYTLAAEAYLDTDITSNLSWRVAAGWTYDNTPAAGFGRDDTTLTTGIAVKF